MVAGLALGESTPGPLIMVNTFVGFLAGYHVEGGLAWGVAGATVATLATFVPSFVFIIAGAPVIDRIRASGSFASSLNGITIAVVGVIAALAVFVARHALIVDDRPRLAPDGARRRCLPRRVAVPESASSRPSSRARSWASSTASSGDTPSRLRLDTFCKPGTIIWQFCDAIGTGGSR